MEWRHHKKQSEFYSQSKRRAEAISALQKERARRKLHNRHQPEFPESQVTSDRWIEQEAETLAQSFSMDLDLSDGNEKIMEDSLGLTHPQWMTEFPEDLPTNWLVMPRPEGRRCMLTASKGRTVSRLKTGGILHTFKSCLPGGNTSRMDGPSVLDCIFHEPAQTYYILDLLCWKGVYVMDCEAEFRLSWIKQKLGECEDIHEETYRIEALEWWVCDETGLLKAFYDYVPFLRDGICLYHKDGHYQKGSSELVLLWKDLTCSRYLIETDFAGKPTEHQLVILRLGEDDGLYSGDDPEIYLCSFSECKKGNLMEKDTSPHQGTLMKFRIQWLSANAEVMIAEQKFHLEFVSYVRNRRRNADLMSKIIFQRNAREGKIRSDDLLRFLRTHHPSPSL